MVKSGVNSGQPRLAFWLERDNLAACEIAALAGFELVIIDMEHGALGPEALDRIVAHCRASRLVCYVRVAAPDRMLIQQALDFGADGVMLPQIVDAGHAVEVAAYAKYPPLGSRGVGYSRTMRYGWVEDGFFEAENRRTLCCLMIETPGALRDVDTIVNLDTVDGLFIGPSDLSMTRGRGPFRFSAGDAEDFRTVAAAASRAGKPLGLPTPSRPGYDLAVELKADYVTISDDLSALQAGFKQALNMARSGTG
ncbi:MAG: 2,4-dihydroxyhept-2-ene-1,7-dioic acid aldolase [Rhizobiales bacterium]|jgi:2-dehydro-3-deoxyglucarate aldolase/4-hydroxy-2-oxoheptanedioate aldolase|nr:2,4-dihydroxyhept-2-ene-1,7-dioic acid aldolase [Hyphomicrobiales bacterium]